MIGNVIYKRPDKFAQVSNQVIKDKRLSWKARGIYCFLASVATVEGWCFDREWVIKQSEKDGQTSYDTGIEELKKYGYLEIKAVRGENGKFTGWNWYLNNEPKNTEENHITGNLNFGKVKLRGIHTTEKSEEKRSNTDENNIEKDTKIEKEINIKEREKKETGKHENFSLKNLTEEKVIHDTTSFDKYLNPKFNMTSAEERAIATFHTVSLKKEVSTSGSPPTSAFSSQQSKELVAFFESFFRSTPPKKPKHTPEELAELLEIGEKRRQGLAVTDSLTRKENGVFQKYPLPTSPGELSRQIVFYETIATQERRRLDSLDPSDWRYSDLKEKIEWLEGGRAFYLAVAASRGTKS